MTMTYPPYFWGKRASTATFTPASLSGLVSWLRADQLIYTDIAGTTPVTSNGDPVGNWASLGSLVRPFAAAANINRPIYVSSWTNGRPAVNFTGGSYYLLSSAWAEMIAQEFTIFSVATSNGTTASNRTQATINDTVVKPGGGIMELRHVNFAPYEQVLGTTAVIGNVAAGITIAAGPAIYVARWKTTDVIDITGIPTATNSIGGATLVVTGNTGQSLGGSASGGQIYNAAIAEVAFYNRAVTDGELAQLQAYASTRYAIT